MLCRYIYYKSNSQPTEEDRVRSETREARLREGTFSSLPLCFSPADRSRVSGWGFPILFNIY